jgi:signal transduction histidine kinase
MLTSDLTESRHSAAASSLSTPVMVEPDSNPGTILVVDDEPNNFDVIEAFLCRDGYEFHYAASGRVVLQQLSVFQPDVILLDVMMPDLDGLEVCRQIKADPAWNHIPIIMVTALDSKEDLSRCLETGADDFISKPINRLELQARVRSMLRIKQQHDNLRSLLQLREDMAQMMVHDLRNPLTNIKLATWILQQSQNAEMRQRKISEIEASTQRLQSMIDDLLLMARLESNQAALQCDATDLGAIAHHAVADFQASASQKQIQLRYESPQVAPQLQIDAVLMRRVLDNLLSNAIKFTPTEGEIAVVVNYPDYPSRHNATICVTDTGIGIREDLKAQIFTKYATGDQVKGVRQIGLGLAFCKLAIEAHGGSIEVQDNRPHGTVFLLHLPDRPAELPAA